MIKISCTELEAGILLITNKNCISEKKVVLKEFYKIFCEKM